MRRKTTKQNNESTELNHNKNNLEQHIQCI